MEGANSFSKGLHRSNSPNEQPQGSYVDAMNWIRNDSGRLLNEELETKLLTGNFLTETTLLGYCSLKNEFICFLKSYNTTTQKWNSIIGTFTEGIFTEIFNDKNHNYLLNFTKDIDSVARIVSSGNRIVYFVEEDNPIRRFDLDLYISNQTNYDSFEDFNLQLTVKYPKVSTSILEGGTLKASVYSFVTRYIDNSNNKTAWSIPTRLISIVPGDAILTEGDTGASPETSTNKKIRIDIDNVDKNYPLIEVAVLTYTGLGNILTSKSIGVFKNEKTFVDLNSDSDYGIDVDINSVVTTPVYYDSAKCIEQKDKRLILSNITVRKQDDAFQEIANNIVVAYYFDKSVTFDEGRSINSRGHDVSQDSPRSYANTQSGNLVGLGTVDYTGVVDQWYGIDGSGFSIQDTYNNTTNLYKDSTVKKGFQPGETYSFSITPVYSDGSIGYACHIPCNNTVDAFGVLYNTVDNIPRYKTKAYKSSINYPLYMEPALSGPIRHHTLPHDFDPVTYVNGVPTVNILRVSFHNVVIPPAVRSRIQAFIIGYQERTDDSNTSVIDEGMAIPYLKSDKSDTFYNNFLDGHGRVAKSMRDGEDGRSNAWQYPCAMYYSPSTELPNGLRFKEGYKFQVWKYARNYYRNSGRYLQRYSTLRHVKTSGQLIDDDENPFTTNSSAIDTFDAEFFDGNRFSTSNNSFLRTITKVHHNETSNHYTTLSEVGIGTNSKFTIQGGSNFVHIETDGQVFWSNHSINQYGNLGHYCLNAFYNDPDEANSTGNAAIDREKRVFSIYDHDETRVALARVINPITNQYGQISDAQYAILEYVTDFTLTDINVEGDTYYFKHWFTNRSAVRYRPNTDNNSERKWAEFELIAGIWLRSKNNFALRHTDGSSAPFYPNYKTFYQQDSWVTYGANWWQRSLGYNKQYSAINKFKVNFPRPLIFNKEISVYENRTIYSELSFESELTDKYRDLVTTGIYDLPRDKGVITDTFVFNNNLYIHTEYGLWLSYFNPNTTQATSQGEITLGNAGLFTIPSKLVTDLKGGYMGTKDKSGINTPFGRIFIDHHQKKVFMLSSESVEEISDLGLFSFFREFINEDKRYNIGYDWKNKRALITNNSADITEFKNDNYTFNLFFNNTTKENPRNLGILNGKIALTTNSNYPAFPIAPIVWLKFKLEERKRVIINALSQYNSTLKIYTVGQNNQLLLIDNYNLLSTGVFDPSSTHITNANLDKKMTNININLGEGEYYISFESNNQAQRNTRVIKIMGVPDNSLAISYYPKTQTWTSFHDFAPKSYLTMNGYSYAWKENAFYDLSNQNGLRKKSYITFVENTLPDAFKRFDRMEINTMSGGENKLFSPGAVLQENYTFLDKSFTHIHCWTDRQNTTELPLFYSHDYNLMSEYYNDRIPVNYYRSSFHIELPFDAVLNPYDNIFLSSNLDINRQFKSHLKSKFLYTKLSYNEDKPIALSYVKTFFKPAFA